MEPKIKLRDVENVQSENSMNFLLFLDHNRNQKPNDGPEAQIHSITEIKMEYLKRFAPEQKTHKAIALVTFKNAKKKLDELF